MDLAARFLNLPADPPSLENSTTRTDVPNQLAPLKGLRQIQKRLPTNEILALVEAYQRGATVAQLTRDYGINRTTVLDHLVRNHVPRRPHVRKLTDRQVTKAAELYERGWSHSQLAKRYFVSTETIRKELMKNGVKSRPPGRSAGQRPPRGELMAHELERPG